MENKTKLKKTKKFESIVENGEELFFKYGMKRVTVEEICKTAKTSKVTFYKHFKNKDGLIEYIFNKWMDEGYDILNKIDTDDTPFEEKVQAMLDFKLYLANKMSPQFMDEFQHMSPSFKKIITDLKIKSYTRIIEYIKRWQEKDEIRSDMKPEFFLAILNKMDELYQNDQLSSLYDDYKDYIKEVFNFIFYGVSSPKKD